MEKGFTLVELSIVLVIIGLLIGGILVGQSLIESAKVNAQVKQITQFDIAVASFISKFKGIPGDSSALGCTGSLCNNKLINDSFSAGFTNVPAQAFRLWYFDQEVANFWPQLQKSGFMQGKPTFSNSLASGFSVSSSTPNSPRAEIDKNSGFVVGSFRNQDVWKSYTVYQLADYSGLTGAGYPAPDAVKKSMTPVQALAIDTKMDDGSAEHLVGAIYPARPEDYYGVPDDWVCAPSWKYNVASSSKDCALVIQVMSGAGGLPNRVTDY